LKQWVAIVVASGLVFTAIVFYIREEPARAEPIEAPNVPDLPSRSAQPFAGVGVNGSAPPAAQSPLMQPSTSVHVGKAPTPTDLDPRSIPANPSPQLRQEAERFLGTYDDPSRRGELIEAILDVTRFELDGFDKERKLDAATFEKLVRLQAEFQLEAEAMQYRCTLYPGCGGSEYRGIQDRHIDAVDALIGTNGYFHSKSWTHSAPTRRMVRSFSRNLPTPLSTPQSNALLDVLADQRGIYIHGYSESRERFAPFVAPGGLEVLYSRDAGSVEDRMASARAYSRHIRGLAATVLKGEQLRTFNRLQDEALRDLQPFLRSQQDLSNEGS
jgi:hypothetical protein